MNPKALFKNLFSKLQPRPICWSGLDMAIEGLTSFVMVTLERENLRVEARFWVPEGVLAARKRDEIVLWNEFAKRKDIATLPGSAVDFDLISEKIEQEKQKFRIKNIGLDRWGYAGLKQALQKRKLSVISLTQGYTTMSPSMKTFEYLRAAGKIRCDDPVLNWMIGNLHIRRDAAGNIMPDRLKSSRSIGGVFALLMAISLWAQ